jgi:hypothetical protein
MIAKTSLGAIALALPLLGAAASAAGPDPSTAYIERITYSGSGCPQGTVGQSIADDRLSFTLIFDSFVASKGVGVPVTESRRNCLLVLQVHTPPGKTWELTDIDRRGYVQLDAGVSAEARIDFADQKTVRSAVDTFLGPTARDYLASDSVESRLSEKRCGGTSLLLLNTQVALAGTPQAQGQITDDSIDGKQMSAPPSLHVGLMLKPCAPARD